MARTHPYSVRRMLRVMAWARTFVAPMHCAAGGAVHATEIIGMRLSFACTGMFACWHVRVLPRRSVAMAIPPRINKALDVIHRVTVGVLATSAVYFTFEIFRATWSIQEAKFEARQQAKDAAPAGAASSTPTGGKA